MKNLWSTTRVPVSVLKDAETIKEHEKTIKDLERTVKTLKRENAHLMSILTGTEDKSVLAGTEEKPFPPASEQKTIADEKRDKDLSGVRSVLAHKIREKIIQSALKGEMTTLIYVDDFVELDEADEITGGYSHDDIIEPIIKALREEGYQAGQSTTAFGGFLDGSYFVSWG